MRRSGGGRVPSWMRVSSAMIVSVDIMRASYRRGGNLQGGAALDGDKDVSTLSPRSGRDTKAYELAR